jgi:hypothetical protein
MIEHLSPSKSFLSLFRPLAVASSPGELHLAARRDTVLTFSLSFSESCLAKKNKGPLP